MCDEMAEKALQAPCKKVGCMAERLQDILDRTYEVERVMRWAFYRIVHVDNTGAETMASALRNLTLLQEELKSAIKGI